MDLEDDQAFISEDHEDKWIPNPENAKLVFLNYIPRNKHLKEHIGELPPDIIKDKMEYYANLWKEGDEDTEDDELLKMVSQKSNWDLKRDLESKLEKLDRSTQKALANLLNEKIKQKSNVIST